MLLSTTRQDRAQKTARKRANEFTHGEMRLCAITSYDSREACILSETALEEMR